MTKIERSDTFYQPITTAAAGHAARSHRSHAPEQAHAAARVHHAADHFHTLGAAVRHHRHRHTHHGRSLHDARMLLALGSSSPAPFLALARAFAQTLSGGTSFKPWQGAMHHAHGRHHGRGPGGAGHVPQGPTLHTGIVGRGAVLNAGVAGPGVVSGVASQPTQAVNSAMQGPLQAAVQKLTGSLAQFQQQHQISLAGSTGKDRAWVDGNIDAAFLGKPGDLGLVDPGKLTHGEWTVSDAAKSQIDAFGRNAAQVGSMLGQVESWAKQLGIDTTLYRASGQSSSSTTLAGDVNGPSYVGAYTKSQGEVRVGLTGLEASGSAEAGLEARAGVAGKTEGRYGAAEGYAKVSVHAKASADGTVKIGPNGLDMQGNLYAGVAVRAEAGGRLESKPFVTLGGVPMTLSAEGKVTADAGAYASANLKASATWSPPQAVVQAEAGAFAGARVGAEGTIMAGPVGVKGRAEAWAGVGVEAHLNAGYKDGKLSLDFGLGAALGVGGKLSGGVEIDVGKIGQMAEGVAKDAEKLAGNAGKEVAKAVDNVGKGVAKTVQDIGKGIADAFKKIKIF
jgi:hypothetical protein